VFLEEAAMKRVLILGGTLVMLLAGCSSAQTEKVKSTGPSKQQMEELAPITEDKYTAEDVTKEAAAANDEVTLEVLGKMSVNYATLLGNCQLIKYKQESGTKALRQWTDDFPSSDNNVWVQKAMIKEGYSCTFQEMNQVATTGTLGSSDRQESPNSGPDGRPSTRQVLAVEGRAPD
jgi:hypothetical protein